MDYSPWSSKNLINRNQLKKFMQVGVKVMCMHTSLVGVVPPVSKTAKFPWSPWSSKNLINRNRLKKFMQVGVDVTCMHTSFGGCGPSGFGDMATFQKWPNFPFGKFNQSGSTQKIYPSRD